MTAPNLSSAGLHWMQDLATPLTVYPIQDAKLAFQADNFFHPLVGKLIEQLNRSGSLAGMLDPTFISGLDESVEDDRSAPNSFFKLNKDWYGARDVQIEGRPKNIDLEPHGPYANYNWELLFHFPFTVAVHLSKNQRFAEARRWFHFIFDPTAATGCWRFLKFSRETQQIDEVLSALSSPSTDSTVRDQFFNAYHDALKKPFNPHAVARNRIVAYQFAVVMKYLDNLIAWGDSLFRQDTIESINEATQLYVLAANVLGARPQRIPRRGTVRGKTFAELNKKGLDEMGNALVQLESDFPFNLAATATRGPLSPASPSLFGIGRALYFCIPRNDKLLGYWDTVGDRLFKIRHCMNIEGVVRQLALFDPPIDPGMLVKAAAAGIDIGSIVNGLNQPVGPVRSLLLIQKALELAAEVRGLGNSLLSAIEKGDSERLALLRQAHEIKIQQMQQDVRFLHWKQAEEGTEALLRSRATSLERYRYYLRLLGQPVDANVAPDVLPLDRRELTEENFDAAYAALVENHTKQVPANAFPRLAQAGANSPSQQSATTGAGSLYLIANEDSDLNEKEPEASRMLLSAGISDTMFGVLGQIPHIGINMQWWGVGSTLGIGGGQMISAVGGLISGSLRTHAAHLQSQAARAAKTASYERRADDWVLQANLAARELTQIGRQIIASLIAEQVAHRDYLNIQRQIEQSEEVDQFLREKFTNEELYAWMQGEISRLYYEYYRFAFDTARRAEQTMKRELMRPEVDATDYIKFNYWDGGRKGLLSGEALYLDVKRLEMAYHDNNKREYELTKHISLRQLNPRALLDLRSLGTCEFAVPEWLFDIDNPGHYMRRIKMVSLTIPAVAGPYTSVSCRLSLLKSSLRKSAALKEEEYRRADGADDERFIDYAGAIQSVVTSRGNDDSGMFEANLRDERLLPFEGAGAVSTWKLELPSDLRQFDYGTVPDVILHLRYTARQGVDAQKVTDSVKAELKPADDEPTEGSTPAAAPLALLLSLRSDFPGEWQQFVAGSGSFSAELKLEHFPYLVQYAQATGSAIEFDALQLFLHRPGAALEAKTLSEAASTLPSTIPAALEVPRAALWPVSPGADVFALIGYRLKS